jgi:hypothetical protein
MREHGDVARAAEGVTAAREQLAELEREFAAESAAVGQSADPAALTIERDDLRPRKSDITVERVVLLWMPWHVQPDGSTRPAHS